MAKSALSIPCPSCGAKREIVEKEWRETFTNELKWDGRKKEYIQLPGPDAPIECHTCKASYPARDWHRSYERDHFRKVGWITVNMQKEHVE